MLIKAPYKPSLTHYWKEMIFKDFKLRKILSSTCKINSEFLPLLSATKSWVSLAQSCENCNGIGEQTESQVQATVKKTSKL